MKRVLIAADACGDGVRACARARAAESPHQSCQRISQQPHAHRRSAGQARTETQSTLRRHDRAARERARRARAGAAGDPGHRPGLGGRGVVERRLLRRHRLGVQHVRRGAVRARHRRVPRLDVPRRRPAALARDVRQARRAQHSVRHHPAGSLGLVPQGDQERRRPEGAEDALLRAGREGHGEARRRHAAARAGRHLPGAAARHARRDRVLAAGDGPEARLPPGRQVLLLPGLAPAGDVPRVLHQRKQVGSRSPTSTRR